MKKLHLRPDILKPEIILDTENQIFKISGRSCPENVIEFYQPVIDWLEEYKSKPLAKTIFDFKLQYYNTSSSKLLFVIMQKLENIHESGNHVLVRWYYPEDDEAIREAGEEFNDLIETEFELISI